MNVPNASVAGVLQAGLALAELGKDVADGKVPNPLDVARAVSSVIVGLASIDDLKRFLEEADQKRIDLAAELAAGAKMGPRP